MKTISYLVALVMISVTAIAQEKKVLDNLANETGNEPQYRFEKEVHEFGTIKQGDVVSYDFQFSNVGTEPLIITKAEGSCGCTVPTFPKEPVMKGQTATIKVTFNSAGKMGEQDKTVTLTSNAKQNPMVLHIKGLVEKPAEQPAVEKQEVK